MISCIEAKGSKQFFVPSCGTYTKIKGYYMQSDWIKLGGVSGPTATSYECMLCFQSLKVELFFSNTSLICIKEPFSSIYPILFLKFVFCVWMSVTVRRDCKALSVEITWNKDVSFLKHHIVLLTTFCLRPLSVFIIVLYCGLPPSRWETGKSQKWWWCTLYLGEEVESDLVSVAVCGTVVCTATSQEEGPGFNSQLCVMTLR